MGILDRVRGKKPEEEKPKEEVKKVATDLERICSDDKEAYDALSKTMLLDPKKTEVTIEEAEDKAKVFEQKGDASKATIWYQLAGGLAIYKGDVRNVKKYFGKCAELSPNASYTILKIPERAVAKAQEYYKKHLLE